jgi:hypothetical protein
MLVLGVPRVNPQAAYSNYQHGEGNYFGRNFVAIQFAY